MPSITPVTSMLLNGVTAIGSLLVASGVTPAQVPQGAGWLAWASLGLSAINLYLHGTSAPVAGPMASTDPLAGVKKS